MGVVADDLTGAADCAVRFAAPGAPVPVVLGDRFEGDARLQAIRWTHDVESPNRPVSKQV
jgi:uncharacterized protein YgbK (DUF1537 family)